MNESRTIWRARHLWASSHILWSHTEVICGARWLSHELYDSLTIYESRTIWLARDLWASLHILWSHSDVICGARWFVTNFMSYYLYMNHELYDRETFVGVITHSVESHWRHLRCQMICHELWGTVVASLHIWIHHVTHFDASRGTYVWVMSRIWVRQVARVRVSSRWGTVERAHMNTYTVCRS